MRVHFLSQRQVVVHGPTNFVDPNNNPMTFNIMQNERYINGSTSHSNAKFTQTGPQTFTVTASTTVGVWKIYVYAFDGQNNVGVGLASFSVH